MFVLFSLAGAENGADEPAKIAPGAAAEDGIPPTFTEKPKIIPNESGTLVTMKFRVRAKPKAEMQWYKGNQKIHEDSKFKSKYIELGNDEYEVLLEILVQIFSIKYGNNLYFSNRRSKGIITNQDLQSKLYRNQLQMMVGTTNAW